MDQTQRKRAEQILDTALAQGESTSWEQVQLHAIAAQLGLSLNDVRVCYAQKDELVEAWFDRADQAALAAYDNGEIGDLPAAKRLTHILMAWLDALAPHRRLTREMLAYKLEPGHLHLQVLGLMRISRTVQWFREAAQEDTRGLQRITEETALSALYLIAFARWLRDNSPGSRNTRQYIETALRRQDRLLAGIFSGKCCTGSQENRTPANKPAHVIED